MRSVLLSSVCLLAMTSSASAEPVSLITAVFTNALLAAGASAGVAGLVGSALAYASVAAAGIFLSSALTPQQGRTRQNIDPGSYKSTFSETESSEVNAVGQVRLGGLKAFGNTSGSDRYRIVCSCKGEVVEVLNYYLDGRIVTVDGSGFVKTAPYTRTGGSYVRILEKHGTGGESAWSELISVFPDLWTSSHRLRGIAQAFIRYTSPGLTHEKFTQLYQNGAPELEREMKVTKIYDPRLDSTVEGGSGSQRADDSSTWAWSDNGPLVAVHVMRSDESLAATDFNWERMITSANAADVLVSAQGGTQKRSRCWGVWPSETRREDVMQQVLESIGGVVRMDESNLIYVDLIDDDPASELTLSESDIVNMTWKAGPEAVDRPNICRVRYYSPERNYNMHELDISSKSWSKYDDEITEYGKKYFDVNLPFCPSPAQAQRIARRMFEEERADRGLIETKMVGLAAWGKRVVSVPLPDLSETIDVLVDPARVDDDEGRVEIPYRAVPSLSAWDYTTDEVAAPDQLGGFPYEGGIATPAAPTRIVVANTDASTKVIRARYGDMSAYDTVNVIYKVNDGAWLNATAYDDWAQATGDFEGDTVVFKFRVTDGGDVSQWSPEYEVESAAYDTAVPSGSVFTLTDDDNGTNDPVTATLTFSCADINYARYTVEKQVDGGGYTTLVSDTYDLPFADTVETDTIARPAGPGSTTVDYRVTYRNSTGQTSTLVQSITVDP